MVNTTHLIYFSPTGTTRKVSESIAKGLGAERIDHYDTTLPGAALNAAFTKGVAIIGVPVYAGRVPALCLNRLAGISAKQVPTVIVAVYGNRAFEDALVELRDIATEKGFHVIAAGAFIGQHSYSTPDRPIAEGRPNAEDLAAAVQFGQRIATKMKNGVLNTPEIAGNVPYKAPVSLGGIAPETNPEKCTLCGQCEAVCPTGVIRVAASVKTDAERCIMCCACVNTCTFAARALRHTMIEEKRTMLINNCRSAKMPTVFL